MPSQPLADAPYLSPLQSTNLREQAVAAIRGSIISGEAAPGRIYSVRQFADQLGVSATPVREALLDLAGDGLVEPVRNRGFRVVMPSEEDLDEIYTLRLMLEVPAAAMAAERVTAEVLARCRRYADVISKSAQKGDLSGFLEADRSFHLEILRATANRRLVETVLRLRDETRLVGLPALRGTDTLLASAHEHIEILDALSTRDAATAATITRRHIEHVRGIWAGQAERVDGG